MNYTDLAGKASSGQFSNLAGSKSYSASASGYANLSQGISTASGAAPVVFGDLMDMYKAYNPTFIGNPQQNFNNIKNVDQLQGMRPNYMNNNVQSIGVGKMFVNSQKNALEGASAFSSLGPWGMLGGATGGTITSLLSDIGHNTIGRDKTQDAINVFNNQLTKTYDSSMRSSIDSMDEMASRNRNISYFAEGGQLQGIEDQLFNEFNNGGSHESNPNGGIPQGFGMNGNPNMVEEGEVKFKDYIFSNRISLDQKTAKQLQLPEKFVKKSYADIAKNLQREHKERQNDPISKAGVEAMLGRLQQAQEIFKAARQPRTAPNTFSLGGDLDGQGEPPTSVVNYSVTDTDNSHQDNNKPFFSESIRKSIYNNITPNLYPAKELARTAGRLVTGKTRPYGTDAVLPEGYDSMSAVDEDAWLKYLQLPQKNNLVTESQYRPTEENAPFAQYHTIRNGYSVEDFDRFIISGASENLEYQNQNGNRSNRTVATSPFWPLQNVTYGKGSDEKGNYFSIYDKYDFDIPGEGLVGKPYEIYDRVYYKTTVQGELEPQYYSNKELENIDLSKLNKSEIDNVGAELRYKGFETYTDKQLAQSLQRYQEASKNPKDTLPQTTPRYNSTPNKYGKPKKNVNRNVLAEGGSLDGLKDPPIVFDPNALRNSDPKLQPQYTVVDNTNVVQKQAPKYTPQKQTPIKFIEPTPVTLPTQQSTPIDGTYTTQSTPISNQEVVTITAQDFLTDFMSRPVQDELYEQELAELNPQQRQLVESIGKETIDQGRRDWSDKTFGKVSQGKDYNAVQDWWRDFSQTSKGQEITKFINNPIINAGAMVAAPQVAVGLMAADYADQYGQGADAGEIGKEVLQDIGTMMVAGRLLGGNQLNMMPNNLGAVRNPFKTYEFKMSPNSMTRGIGDEAGLIDLTNSGIVRGNPKGRLISPKDIAKYKKNNPAWNEFERKHPEAAEQVIANSLTESNYNLTKNYFKKNPIFNPTSGEVATGTKLLKKTSRLDTFEKEFPTYKDYLNQDITKNRLELNPNNNEPMAHWFENGQLPVGQQYPSKYFVKLKNSSKYEPYIPESHFHPTTTNTVKFRDPNLEVYESVVTNGKTSYKLVNKDAIPKIINPNYAPVNPKNIDPKTGMLKEFLLSDPSVYTKSNIGKSVVGASAIAAGTSAAGLAIGEVQSAKQQKIDRDLNFEVGYLEKLYSDLMTELYSETPNDSIIDITIKEMEKNKDNYQKFNKHLSPEARKHLLKTQFIKDE